MVWKAGFLHGFGMARFGMASSGGASVLWGGEEKAKVAGEVSKTEQSKAKARANFQKGGKGRRNSFQTAGKMVQY